MPLTFIKHQKDWDTYARFQNARVSLSGVPVVHEPAVPTEYPCIVVTDIDIDVNRARFVHTLIYPSAARKLLKLT